MSTPAEITVRSIVDASINQVWDAWNNPADIIEWNTPDPSWHTTSADNDPISGGKFKYRMEAKDGSFGFDFEGTYDNVEVHREMSYTMPDGRKVTTLFEKQDGKVMIATTFDPEKENDPDFQKQGWQSILNTFVEYVEARKL